MGIRFTDNELMELSKVLGDTSSGFTGTEIGALLTACGFRDPGPITKRDRMFLGLQEEAVDLLDPLLLVVGQIELLWRRLLVLRSRLGRLPQGVLLGDERVLLGEEAGGVRRRGHVLLLVLGHGVAGEIDPAVALDEQATDGRVAGGPLKLEEPTFEGRRATRRRGRSSGDPTCWLGRRSVGRVPDGLHQPMVARPHTRRQDHPS